MVDFFDVDYFLKQAVALTWDECHKIYVLMDEGQVEQMVQYEYDPIVRIADIGLDEAKALIRKWYEESCGLKFVQAVSSGLAGGEPVFSNLIHQGADEQDEQDEDY